ncbi:MAG: DUF2752 domain-containing protein [Bacteroidales bacterium]|nr:DUF2752 domain-containing protein [Bacteroidales bacterium]
MLILLFLGFLVYIYGRYNPAEHQVFPKCPFRTLTGYKCPGCGSQRAIHEILQGNIVGAFHFNMLLVIAIPYLITGFIFDRVKNPGPVFLSWRKRLFGRKAIFIVLAIIVFFWILRNTPVLT